MNKRIPKANESGKKHERDRVFKREKFASSLLICATGDRRSDCSPAVGLQSIDKFSWTRDGFYPNCKGMCGSLCGCT